VDEKKLDVHLALGDASRSSVVRARTIERAMPIDERRAIDLARRDARASRSRSRVGRANDEFALVVVSLDVDGEISRVRSRDARGS